MSIFSDIIGTCINFFMDDFTVHNDSVDSYLENLNKILERYISNNLVLN